MIALKNQNCHNTPLKVKPKKAGHKYVKILPYIKEMRMRKEIITTGSKSRCVMEERVKEDLNKAKIELLKVIEEKSDFSKQLQTSPNKDHHKKVVKRKSTWVSDIIPKKARKEDCSTKSHEIEKEENVKKFEMDDYVDHNKDYFFLNLTKIPCKLCSFKGKQIVQHYKTSHPESEVLISRIDPDITTILIQDGVQNQEEYDKDHPKLEKMTCNFKCPFCLVFIKDTANAYYNHISSHTGEYCFYCNNCSYWTYNYTNILSHANQKHYKIHKAKYKMVYPDPKISKYIFGHICSECNFIQLTRAAVEEHAMVYHPGSPEIHKVNLGVLLHEDAVDKNHTNKIRLNDNPSNLNNCLSAIASDEDKELSALDLPLQIEKLKVVKLKNKPNVSENEPTTFICQPNLDIKQDSESNRMEMLQWMDENERMAMISDRLQSKLGTEPVEESEKVQTDISPSIPLLAEVKSSKVKFPEIASVQSLAPKAKHLTSTRGNHSKCTTKKQNRKCTKTVTDIMSNLKELVPPYNCEDDGFPSCSFKTLYFEEYLKHVEHIHQIEGLNSFSSEHELLRETIMGGWLVKEVGPFQCRYCKKATFTHQEMERHQAVFHTQEQSLFYYRKFVSNGIVITPEQVNLEDPSFINHLIHLPNQVHLCDFKLTDGLLSSTSAELAERVSEELQLQPSVKDLEVGPNQQKILLNESEILSLPFDNQTGLINELEPQYLNERMDEALKCKWKGCDRIYDCQIALAKHIEDNHIWLQNGKEFCCFWINCPRKLEPFSQRHELLLHMMVHRRKRKSHKCLFPGCNRIFSKSWNLKIHQRTHTGEKPYLCEFQNCSKSFTTNSSRMTHQKTHCNVTYACQVTSCSKRYSHTTSLSKHLKTHMVDKQLEAKQKSVKKKQKKDDFDVTKHQRTPYDTLQCKWKGCYQTYDSQTAFVKHIEDKHVWLQSGEEFNCFWIKCPRQLEPFSKRHELLLHMRVHQRKSHKCPFQGCDKAFARSWNLKVHQMSHTGEKPYLCQFQNCSKSFFTTSDRVKHQRTHCGTKTYVCQVTSCSKKYAHSASLSKHLKTHIVDKQLEAEQKSVEDEQKEDDFECKWKGCYQTHDSQTALVKHIEEDHVKLQSKEFSCFWINCPRKLSPFNKRHELLSHMSVHRRKERKSHKCPGCNKTFTKSWNLKIHQRTHTGEKPYICKFQDCSKSFSDSSARLKHQRTHCNTKTYVCQVTSCSKKYANARGLSKHLRITHTVEEQLEVKWKSVENEQKEKKRTVNDTCKWEGCYQTNHSQMALVKHIGEDHIKSQSGKEFSCFWINCPRKLKPFNKRYHLLLHMRVHSGEKPYKCSFQGCNKAFAKSWNLSNHKRIHTGEKQLCQFPTCFKSFSDASTRIKHQKTHDNIKPYVCQVTGCSNKCIHSYKLTRHLRNHTDNEQLEHNQNHLRQFESVKSNQKEDDFIVYHI